MNKNELINVILSEIKNICEETNINVPDINIETEIFGEGSILDSLGLVTLVVKLEDYLIENSAKEIQIVDDEAILTGTENSLRTPNVLADLILSKLYDK
jgi:acyl carrier protein